jgi:hypothetical protein
MTSPSTPPAGPTPPGTPPPTPPPTPVDYDWAVLRAIPRVHVGTGVNVAVLVHARTTGFLGMRAILDPELLAAQVPGVDPYLLARYLKAAQGICEGTMAPDAGHRAVTLAPPSERFHWLTAPRSDVLQPSAVHGGTSTDLERTLETLFHEQVG